MGRRERWRSGDARKDKQIQYGVRGEMGRPKTQGEEPRMGRWDMRGVMSRGR